MTKSQITISERIYRKPDTPGDKCGSGKGWLPEKSGAKRIKKYNNFVILHI